MKKNPRNVPTVFFSALFFLIEILLSLVLLLPLVLSLMKVKKIKSYCYLSVVSFDQTLGVVYAPLLNWILFKKDTPYKLGENIDITISHAIGVNKHYGSLNWFGQIIDNILNSIDKNHSLDAIEHDEIKDFRP